MKTAKEFCEERFGELLQERLSMAINAIENMQAKKRLWTRCRKLNGIGPDFRDEINAEIEKSGYHLDEKGFIAPLGINVEFDIFWYDVLHDVLKSEN